MANYQPGDTVGLIIDWKNDAGTLTNPTTSTLKIRSPGAAAAAVTATYIQSDPAMTNPSTGRYRVDYSIPLAGSSIGTWRVRWEATGTVVKNIEDSFVVDASPFVT